MERQWRQAGAIAALASSFAHGLASRANHLLLALLLNGKRPIEQGLVVVGKSTKFRPLWSPSRAPPPGPARRARPYRPRGARVSRPSISLSGPPQTAAPASPRSHPRLEDGAVYHLTPTEYELAPRAVGQRRSGAEPHSASETGLGIGHTGGRGSVCTYGEAVPPLAGGGRRQARAPLQGAARRLSDAEGEGAVTVTLSVFGGLQMTAHGYLSFSCRLCTANDRPHARRQLDSRKKSPGDTAERLGGIFRKR